MIIGSLIGGALKPHLLKILIAGAVIILILGVFLKGEASGRNKAVVEGLQRKLKNVERANEVERDVDRMSESDVADSLRERWSRD
jgi:hypothetical protein